MITATFRGSNVTSAYGLTQWDYGQQLQVVADLDVPDGTEVHFYQAGLSSVGSLSGGVVAVPDAMLRQDSQITAYVYARAPDSGETVLTVCLPVTGRPKPETYVLPQEQSYQRLLPDGGEPGQVPVRSAGEGYKVAWGDRADNLKVIDGALQLMSGDRPVGDRVRIQGVAGREVELRNNGTAIQWRYTDSNDWADLARMEDLRGPAGESPAFEVRDGHLYAIYQN